MKKFSYLAIALLLSVIGCGEKRDNTTNQIDEQNIKEVEQLPAAEDQPSPPKPAEEPFDPQKMGVSWNVDFSRTNVRWECGTAGSKLYSHFGEIKMKEAELMTDASKLTKGRFVIDMKTIVPQDPNYGTDRPAVKLVQHLSGSDFFNVEKFPEATYLISSVKDEQVTGELTVRGITKEVKMIVDMVGTNPDGSMNAHGVLRFSRKDFNLNWAFPVQDMILNDIIDVHVNLWATSNE